MVITSEEAQWGGNQMTSKTSGHVLFLNLNGDHLGIFSNYTQFMYSSMCLIHFQFKVPSQKRVKWPNILKPLIDEKFFLDAH